MFISFLIVLAYLIGSLSFAVIVSRLFGLPDPRKHGSGNPGATNMLRTGRKSAAALTLIGDMSKGWLAVYLARYFGAQHGVEITATYGAAVAVFLGHLYPIFFGFKGGKGVATALGILFAISPWLGLAALASWLIVFALTRISSLAALTAATLAPILVSYLIGGTLPVAALCIISALIFWRHRTNIHRLLAGEEGRVVKPVDTSSE
ncbi:acyl-phosphate:glycerol-3-phosphate O-acyltransferase PlsY [Sulfuriferula multivorans]|uniref:Glycerol-3-phosphate acyltransferase n=1 Tax=Sulfuriferula multivorans TaxID=1559896 RepID=A0A401JH54_9PROT|nr:glycerol-3-phosphate 1-O-acyltransferase PlsY [Sulfuriferula multivorans]GBL47304.1 acyl-phosphate:glycerol-3-phosphate O-acyltransferase PlsY [Sulfuriferula multivorans]